MLYLHENVFYFVVATPPFPTTPKTPYQNVSGMSIFPLSVFVLSHLYQFASFFEHHQVLILHLSVDLEFMYVFL